MSCRRHTPEQVVRKLREADRLLSEGSELPEVLKHLEVAEATYERGWGLNSVEQETAETLTAIDDMEASPQAAAMRLLRVLSRREAGSPPGQTRIA